MKIETLRVGDKLIILDGVNPMMYVDLVTRTLHQYEEPRELRVTITAGFRDPDKGSRKTKTHTFEVKLEKNAFLKMPISARGEDFVDVKIEAIEDNHD